MGIPRSVSFVGCIGRDKYGQILEDMANKAGVATHFQYNEKESTGTCAVLLTQMNRYLCVFLFCAVLCWIRFSCLFLLDLGLMRFWCWFAKISNGNFMLFEVFSSISPARLELVLILNLESMKNTTKMKNELKIFKNLQNYIHHIRYDLW